MVHLIIEIVGNTMLFAGLIIIILMLSSIRKKSYRYVRKYIFILMGLALIQILVDGSQELLSFSTLKQAVSAYGIKIDQSQIIYGEDSAIVPYESDLDVTMKIFREDNGRWKMPSRDSETWVKEIDEETSNSYDLIIRTFQYVNENGRYIVLQDYRSGHHDEKSITDSEGTEFATYCTDETKMTASRIYYGYLAGIPANYELKLKDEEIQVNWNKIFDQTEIQ